MCEFQHKGCTPVARMICKETGWCPLGGATSDNTVVRLPARQRLVGQTPKDLGVFSIVKRHTTRLTGKGQAADSFIRSSRFIEASETKDDTQ